MQTKDDFLDYNEFTEAVGEYYNFSLMSSEQWTRINQIMLQTLKENDIDYSNMKEDDYDKFCQLADSACGKFCVPLANVLSNSDGK